MFGDSDPISDEILIEINTLRKLEVTMKRNF